MFESVIWVYFSVIYIHSLCITGKDINYILVKETFRTICRITIYKKVVKTNVKYRICNYGIFLCNLSTCRIPLFVYFCNMNH